MHNDECVEPGALDLLSVVHLIVVRAGSPSKGEEVAPCDSGRVAFVAELKG